MGRRAGMCHQNSTALSLHVFPLALPPDCGAESKDPMAICPLVARHALDLSFLCRHDRTSWSPSFDRICGPWVCAYESVRCETQFFMSNLEAHASGITFFV